MQLTFCAICGEEMVANPDSCMCEECSQTLFESNRKLQENAGLTHWDPVEGGSICHESCAIDEIRRLRRRLSLQAKEER